MNIKLSDLTLLGWVLVVVSIATTGLVGLAVIDNLPPGRYPAAGIIVVVAAVGVGVFTLGAFGFKLVGLKVVRPATGADEVVARAASGEAGPSR